MRHKVTSISQRIRLPAICILCNQYHQGLVAVCHACIELLSPIGTSCLHCALPLPETSFLVCGQCCKKKPTFDNTFSAYHFEEPLRSLLHEFKYHEGLYLSSFLATLILKALTPKALITECLIPVPLHPARLKQRGFNHAAELVKYLSRVLKIPCALSHCRKIINTAPQAELSAPDRRNNLCGAFYAKPLPYQHVTLVDDLLTTGSTVNELAKTLKEQGVHQVDVWTCARAAIK